MENAEKDKKQEVMVQPENSNVQTFVSQEALERSIRSAEMYADYLDKIRKISLRLTSCEDWVDQNGKPYLQGTGCSKISGGFGMKVFDVERQREDVTDDRGQYVMYSYSGTGEWNNNSTHETGVASSRDDFFALRTINGEKTLLPLSEIDLTDVQKKAHTNLMNRLIKRLLGLSFSWEEIEKETAGRITREKCSKVVYDKGKKGGNQDTEETKKKKSELRKMILDMAMGDTEQAKAYLQAKTAFSDYKGATSVDVLSEKQLAVVFPKVEKDFQAFQKQVEKETAGTK